MPLSQKSFHGACMPEEISNNSYYCTVRSNSKYLCPNSLVFIFKSTYKLKERRSYLQSRDRDTDVENKHTDTKGKGRGGMNWEIGIDIYTLLTLCIK